MDSSIDITWIHECFNLNNAGRASLEKMMKSSDVFIHEFSAQLANLIPHDFIAKKQAEYLNTRKQQLQQGEYIVISDFSENYSFVVQVRIANMPLLFVN